MGCGASKSVSTSGPHVLEQQRDAEDYSLEAVTLQVTNIDEFDGVFARVCTLLNRLVELNNCVHASVAEVKGAYAPLAGGFMLEVEFGPAADVVLLDIRTSKGDRPEPELVARLATGAAVKTADVELEAARHALHGYLAEHACGNSLRVGRGAALTWAPPSAPSNVAPPEPLLCFNAALAKLRTALGSSATVITHVLPAVAPGTPTVQASIWRAENLGFRTASLPVTVLDVCSSPLAEHILTAEAFLIDRAQLLAHRTKGLEMDWGVSTSYAVGHSNELDNEDIQDQVDRLLRGVNLALFRLLNACASVGSHASLSNAVVEVVRPVVDAIKAKHAHSSLQHRMRQMVSIRPEVEFQNEEEEGVPPTFDFQLNVQLAPEAQVAAFPGCLGELSLNLLSTLEGLKSSVAVALEELPGISAETDELLGRAKEFYELCPDAAAQMGFSMMDAVRCSKATGSNLKTLYETQELFLSFGENIKRVADELADSTYAVHEMMDIELPDGLEQVTEGDHEGMETPVSRAMSIMSVRPSEHEAGRNNSGVDAAAASVDTQTHVEQAATPAPATIFLSADGTGTAVLADGKDVMPKQLPERDIDSGTDQVDAAQGGDAEHPGG